MLSALNTGRSEWILRSWADRLILRARAPAGWLMDLSGADSTERALHIVGAALQEFGEALPDDFGDLLAGFIFLGYRRGAWDRTELIAALADAADAYQPSQFDVEEVAALQDAGEGKLSLQLEQLSDRSASVDAYLRGHELFDTERMYFDRD